MRGRHRTKAVGVTGAVQPADTLVRWGVGDTVPSDGRRKCLGQIFVPRPAGDMCNSSKFWCFGEGQRDAERA